MSEWKQCRLGDIVHINNDTYSPRENWKWVNYLDTGNLNENNINTLQFIDLSINKLPSRARRKVNIGSILYSTVRPNQRHYGYIKHNVDNLLVSTGFAVIDVDKAKADSKYIYYYLTQNDITEHLQSIAEQAVTTYPSITPTNIENLTIPLPSLPTQRKIASILSALDDKIELNNRMNKNLEEQARAIYKSWFVDFEPWGGVMPSDWRVGSVSELGKVVGGGTPSKSNKEYYTNDGIAWVTPKDLSNNKSKFIAHGEIDITDLGLAKSSATLMPKGSVLFSSRAPIGYLAISDGEVSTNQGFKSIVPFKNIGTAYVYYFLKENTEKIENIASGSTFKEVSGSTMKTIEVIIPDDITLRKFQSLCFSLFEQQKMLEYQSRHLSALRDALLPKLMSGELDVSDINL